LIVLAWWSLADCSPINHHGRASSSTYIHELRAPPFIANTSLGVVRVLEGADYPGLFTPDDPPPLDDPILCWTRQGAEDPPPDIGNFWGRMEISSATHVVRCRAGLLFRDVRWLGLVKGAGWKIHPFPHIRPNFRPVQNLWKPWSVVAGWSGLGLLSSAYHIYTCPEHKPRPPSSFFILLMSWRCAW
jgi:hypothetical protein